MSSFSYSERLRLLNLDSLEMPRLRADLMLCLKMLKEFVDVDSSEFCERVAPDSVTRGHRCKLVHPTRGHRYKLVPPVFVLMLDNISLQFEVLQFGTLFVKCCFLRPSRFLVLRHASLEKVWQGL